MRSTARAEAITKRFGTTDLAIVMGLWSAMAVLLGGVLSELASDTETPMARAQSEAYALQLAQSLEPTSEPGDRGPASVDSQAALQSGELGKDPWGSAYRYKVVSKGVVVWSIGKNNQSDSSPAIARLESGQSIAEFHFGGDDVGFIKPLKNSR